MKKALLMVTVLAAMPVLSQATDLRVDVDRVRIQAGGITLSIGDRDHRGYYWDGGVWRDPVYWKKHHPHDYHEHRDYDRRGRHCPPGQAKKGNC